MEATDCEGGQAGLGCRLSPNKSGDQGPPHQSAACSKTRPQGGRQALDVEPVPMSLETSDHHTSQLHVTRGSENMLKRNSAGSGRVLNPGPSYCEATVLITELQRPPTTLSTCLVIYLLSLTTAPLLGISASKTFRAKAPQRDLEKTTPHPASSLSPWLSPVTVDQKT